ncbi:EAL domain-containing protein [Bacillus sp. AGMB 02131]|uniref:EAL domain-containing protein n=1 Tax=Peribacillus faecalis TaxID=2772559 RepID=A0A927D069_9BACI|nr:EAL domain-containing protein [Peribacillus faecalis]MBD3110299.1 EAL domain-containing protein [Peribacillus faecalis]
MAKSLNYFYDDKDRLQAFIEEQELQEQKSLLVQIFAGSKDEAEIKSVTKTVKKLLPKSIVIGCTTKAELANGYIYSNEIIISFTGFEQTKVESILLNKNQFGSSREMGQYAIRQLAGPKSKLLFLFTSVLDEELTELLEGIIDEKKNLTVVGGIAYNRGASSSFVFNEQEIVYEGIVAAILHNDDLQVTSFEDQSWTPIGSSFEVTKANNTVIYSINGRKPSQLLKRYLGEYFFNKLPDSSSEFPLLKIDSDGLKPLFIKSILPYGAIEVSDRIEEGDALSFSYVNIADGIRQSELMLKKMARQPTESIFVYYDLAKMRLLKGFAQEELRMLLTFGSQSGFFSYCRFTDKMYGKEEYIGQFPSIVGISESAFVPKRSGVKLTFSNTPEMQPLMVLSHLIEATTSDIKQLNGELFESEQYFKTLFENNNDFIFATDLKGKFTRVNKSFLKVFNVKTSEIIGKSAEKFLKSDDEEKLVLSFAKSLDGQVEYYDISVEKAEGRLEHFHVKNMPITINGEVMGIFGMGRNVTKQKQIEEELLKLAYYDVHTGLPNRNKFSEILKEHLTRAKKKKRELAVVFIDFDRFKVINDSLGHYAGDVILKKLAKRLKRVTPLGSYLGRFAGDKFALVITKQVDLEEIQRVTKMVNEVIAEPIEHGGQEFFITSSIGVALFPEDGRDADSLLKNADIAMNRGKAQGGGQLVFYSDEMNEQALKRFELESYLRRALEKEEFFICYQPLIDLNTGDVYGSEALIRWQHPVKGLVSPADFIPLAEETRLIDDIGYWVLNTACAQNKKWQDLGFGNLLISVNVSAYQFQQPHFLERVKKVLADTGLDPKYLQLELTESMMMNKVNYSISIMQELKSIGVKVSIDDFGTGYSSLSYLKNLPIDSLKIDRSFINNLKQETSDMAIVEAIIMMGHGLSVKVVAEGVEKEEQMSLLKEMKCHYVQGYYIDRPLKTEDFERGIAEKLKVNVN